jgi:hypothetical protein
MSSKKVPVSTRIDYWLDSALLVAFLADYSFNFTGLTIHEWVGLGLGVSMLVHLTLHWEWVIRTTKRVFSKLPGRERLRWFADLLLLFSMVLCIASGVLISKVAMPKLGFTPLANGFWRGMHSTTSSITIAIVGVHIALNWQWIVSVTKRMFRRGSTATSTEAVAS